MLSQLRDKLVGILTSRLFILVTAIFLLFSLITFRLFVLQIIRGETYFNNFTLRIEREKTVKSTRGTIYDRNGVVLAQDTLAYSVTIEDNYDSTRRKNMDLNSTIDQLIDIIESNGNKVINDFPIIVNNNGQFQFTYDGTRQLRFLADIYGHNSIEDLKARERGATPADVVSYLCSREKFGIGEYRDNGDGSFTLMPEAGYSREKLLKMICIRYNLSLNSFQKYISTTVATDVNVRAVAEIMEKKNDLQGVDIAEDTVRSYIDDPSFSHVLGYTGKISEEELIELNSGNIESEESDRYELNDMVGKSGIEQVMERKLQGKKGRQTIFVDNLGRVTDTGKKTDPVAGNDLYLTIDADLQKAIYSILEQKIAGIVLSKIRDVSSYDAGEGRGSANIIIPIDKVYFALFDNNFIDISHLSSPDAGPYEEQVFRTFTDKRDRAVSALESDLMAGDTAFKDLPEELKSYESYAVVMLQNGADNVFDKNKVDQTDPVYTSWRAGELPLKTYLLEAIAQGWIDTTRIESDEKYLDSDEIYSTLVEYIELELKDDPAFAKRVFEYLIKDGEVTGMQVCHLPYEQGKLKDLSKLQDLDKGLVSPYHFMLQRIRSLDITPADLALDPFSGSCVVTDSNTGEVLACVSYPSYDNRRFANTVDSAYYAQLRDDKALPLYDYATQEKTAPGSTFKPVTSTAALEEKVVTPGEQVNCEGVFEKIGDPAPRCWIYPSSTHGNLNISGAIQNSCNYFFYEMGFRMSLAGGHYNSDAGILKLRKYVDMFGLTEKSGIEIEESEPHVSNEDAVRSAIGQGNHNYTTVALARYVNTVSNRGTCYRLSLLGKLTDPNGNIIMDYSPEVRNNIQVASSTWDAIHAGMRSAVEHYGAFKDFPMTAAGKTGTAQQSETRPNHALFIGFAPYNKPEIAVATRIAYGYTSSNAAEVTRDVFRYYFKLADKEEIIKGEAVLPDSAAIGD